MKTKLLPIAEAIDAARIAANTDPLTAMQSGVYGELSNALIDTLMLAAGHERGVRMYAHIIDTGESVQEARRATEPARPMPEPEHGDREYRQLQHEMAWTPERYGGRKG